MDVPYPTICNTCRMQRRLAFRNERYLYHNKCQLTGKQVITSLSRELGFKIYSIDAWWSDNWDALSYGREYDFSRGFFEQHYELKKEVPRLTLQQQLPMENSEYCNCASKSKNCYLVFSSNSCEDCYYGSWVNSSISCLDNLNIEDCELCYECTNCRDCYNLKYSLDCANCSESYFLRDCIGCKNCFGCTSLNKAQYCIYNKQLDKKQYNDFIAKLDFGKHSEISRFKKEIESALGIATVKRLHGTFLEDSSGDYLRQCRRVDTSFECDSCEDIRYSTCVKQTKNSQDFSYWGQNAEWIYECQACGYDLNNLRFCNLCWTSCSNLTYCDHCFSCSNCFGCVGLKKKSYCIFNVQYSKTEYERLVAKITEQMKQNNEWGEFFPVEHSTFAYNESLAQEQIPLSKSQVLKLKWNWQDEDEKKKSSYIGPKIEIPNSIKEVDLEILNKILLCEETSKPYKIIAAELTYYQKNNIPLPRLCPDARHSKRILLKNPRYLWERKCDGCKSKIQTSYAPSRPERVLCESCYEEEIFK